MIGLDLCASANLAVIWIINSKLLLHSDPNMGFGLSCLRFFIANFLYLELFIFTLYLFETFYRGMNKPYRNTNINGISYF